MGFESKPPGRIARALMQLDAGNRRRQDAWDQRGMAAVAGVRRTNLAPRPGKEMGGGSSPAPPKFDKNDKAWGKKSTKAQKAAEAYRKDAKRLQEQAAKATGGRARSLQRAAKRAETKADGVLQDLAQEWKRR